MDGESDTSKRKKTRSRFIRCCRNSVSSELKPKQRPQTNVHDPSFQILFQDIQKDISDEEKKNILLKFLQDLFKQQNITNEESKEFLAKITKHATPFDTLEYINTSSIDGLAKTILKALHEFSVVDRVTVLPLIIKFNQLELAHLSGDLLKMSIDKVKIWSEYASAGRCLSDAIELSGFPNPSKLALNLIGSYQYKEGQGENPIFYIREFLRQLIHFTTKEEVYTYIYDDELAEKCEIELGSITLPRSQHDPAVFQVINKKPCFSEEDNESNDDVGLKHPKLPNCIIAESESKLALNQKDWIECTLLCNGTQDCWKEIEQCVKMKKPLIILKGSGGFSDILVKYLETKRPKNEVILRKFLGEHVTNDETREFLKELASDKGPRDILDIRKSTSQEMLAQSILKALQKSDLDRVTLSKLAIRLNQLELLAQTGDLFQILDDKKKGPRRSLVEISFQLKRYKFLKYMLEQGLDPLDDIKEQDITETYQELPEEDILIQRIKDYCLLDGYTEYANKGIQRTLTENDFKVKNLFILAILTKKFKLAKMFWRYVKYPIGGALYACIVLGKIINEDKNDDIKTLELEQKRYQDYAINTLNNTYSKHREETLQLLLYKMPLWGNKSYIKMAIESESINFSASDACIELNKRLWQTGYINSQTLAKPETETENLPKIKMCFPPRRKAGIMNFGYGIFLIIYAVLLTMYFEAYSYHPLEWVVWSFIVCFLLEWGYQIKHGDGFTILQLCTLILFCSGFFLKVGAYYSNNEYKPGLMEASRIILSIDYILFCCWALEFFYLFKFLGPLLLTIRKMMLILFKFVLIIVVFYVALAVATESVLCPSPDKTGERFFEMNMISFWSIYGQYGFDDLNNISDCSDEVKDYTESAVYYVKVITGVYAVVISTLLMNLLIAIFSSDITPTTIEERKNIWRFQRLKYTRKYNKMPYLLFKIRKLCKSEQSMSVDDIFAKEIKNDYNLEQMNRIEKEEQQNTLRDLAHFVSGNKAPITNIRQSTAILNNYFNSSNEGLLRAMDEKTSNSMWNDQPIASQHQSSPVSTSSSKQKRTDLKSKKTKREVKCVCNHQSAQIHIHPPEGHISECTETEEGDKIIRFPKITEPTSHKLTKTGVKSITDAPETEPTFDKLTKTGVKSITDALETELTSDTLTKTEIISIRPADAPETEPSTVNNITEPANGYSPETVNTSRSTRITTVWTSRSTQTKTDRISEETKTDSVHLREAETNTENVPRKEPRVNYTVVDTGIRSFRYDPQTERKLNRMISDLNSGKGTKKRKMRNKIHFAVRTKSRHGIRWKIMALKKTYERDEVFRSALPKYKRI